MHLAMIGRGTPPRVWASYGADPGVLVKTPGTRFLQFRPERDRGWAVDINGGRIPRTWWLVRRPATVSTSSRPQGNL